MWFLLSNNIQEHKNLIVIHFNSKIMESGKSNFRRLTAKEQLIKIETEKLMKMTMRFLSNRAVTYSFNFN